MDSEAYAHFLKKNFKLVQESTPFFSDECIYMHDNAPLHASICTRDFLALKGPMMCQISVNSVYPKP